MEKRNGFNDKNYVTKPEQLEVDHDYRLINLPTPTAPKMREDDFIPQVAACLAATAILIQTGVNLAYSAVLLPQLMSPESHMRITQDQASWIASIVTISTTFGSLMSGPLMDKFGRKSICQLTCVPLILSWIIIAFTTNVHGIYSGRLLAGLGAGLSTAPLVYVSEVSHTRWRPTLLCLMSTFVSFGILLTCILCLWLDYDKMALCFAVLSLASYLVTLPIPESPHWLLRHRSEKKASDALRWLYRRDVCYQHQLKCLMDSYTPTLTPSSKRQSIIQYFSEYKKRSTLKPILILMVIFIFQQISGAYVIIFYAVNILQIIGGKYGSGISEYMAFALLGVLRFVMSIFTAFASRTSGRRPVSIISGLGMSVSALIAAICINASGNSGNLFQTAAVRTGTPLTIDLPYTNVSLPSSYENVLSITAMNNSYVNTSKSVEVLHLGEFSATNVMPIAGINLLNGSDMNLLNESTTSSSVLGVDDQWVPLVCVLVYVLFSSLGVLVIPWTLIGELPPTSVRGSCGGFMMAFSYVVMFAVVKTFPYVLEVLKIRGMFYTFSTTSFLGAVFVYFFLPETQGKSFQEIGAYFK